MPNTKPGDYMRTVVISSSIRFKALIQQVIAAIGRLDLQAVFPNLDCGVSKEDLTVGDIQELQQEHFAAIDEGDMLYVLCPNGYVGTLVSVEIGYAYALGKPVVFSEPPSDLGLQALATTYVSIVHLERLKSV